MGRANVEKWLKEIRVLDGGFGTEALRRSDYKLEGHKAWSCLLLQNDPLLVVDIHKSYLEAGCDVISTNTYQAAPETLAEALNVGVVVGKALMRKAVDLAKQAVNEYQKDSLKQLSIEGTSKTMLKTIPTINRLPPLIAGSLGPYGACLADGSEYTGAYVETLDFTDLVNFHRKRAEILLTAGVDLLAWETIPAVAEVCAICTAMSQLPNTAVAWISISTLDGQTTAHGEPLHQVAAAIKNCDSIFAIGVNCHIPHEFIGQALANVGALEPSDEDSTAASDDGYHPNPASLRPKSSLPGKLLLAYANSGEQWLQTPKARLHRNPDLPKGHYIWPVGIDPNKWAESVARWAISREMVAGRPDLSPLELSRKLGLAQWIGGCCRVNPRQILDLAILIKPDDFESSTESFNPFLSERRIESSGYNKEYSSANSVRKRQTRSTTKRKRSSKLKQPAKKIRKSE